MSTRWLAIILLILSCGLLSAQGTTSRLNDKDVEQVLKNLNHDAKTFSNSFKKAVSKSTLRKTSREKDAKNLADRFVKDTEQLYKGFKRTKKADTQLPVVFQSARQLQRTASEISLSGAADEQWQTVRKELEQVAAQFGYTPSA